MAALIWQAFADAQFWLIEAPTGTGKTNAYLYPAIVWALTTGQRVFISSSHSPVAGSDSQGHEDAQRMGFPIKYAVLKGRDNHVCWTRWQRVVDETSDPLLRAFSPGLAGAAAPRACWMSSRPHSAIACWVAQMHTWACFRAYALSVRSAIITIRPTATARTTTRSIKPGART